MTESETKSSSHASLKEKATSQPENGKSENNMSSESVENGLKDGIKDDEINENHSKTADESTVQQSAANQGNTEGSTEETDGNEDKEGNNTTNGSAEKTGSENGIENNIPAEAKSEEKVSEVESKATAESEEILNENQENMDSQPEVGENTNTEKATIDAAEVETLAATVNDEDASEQSKEVSNEDASGDIGGKIENTEKVNVENSGGKVAENVEEGLTNDTGGVEGVKVDSEAENKDKDEHLGDNDSGHQDDEKPAASTTESEVVESGRNESEENERKEDEGGSKTVGEGNNDAGGEGNENIGEIEKAESKQDESKGGEIAECQGMKDGAKGVDEGHTDTAAEMSTEERSESQTKNQNKGSNEALVEKATENSSEDLSNKETVEKDGKDTPDKTAAVEPEIAVDPVANLEGNHESHSQVSSPDDNKSEALSENIDDLVDEILAATDDVDAGKKSEGSDSNAKAEEPVVTNESSDDGQPVVTSESVEKSANDVQPVVTSENSEKSADDGQPMVISESSEKNEDGGPVSGGGQEGESSAQAEQTSSDQFHVSDIKEKDANEGEQTEPRVPSGNTVYRVQTDYLTRQVIAKQEKEMYLEEKLNETSRDLEIAERKVKDLQLRLKRFVKDDEAKDQKMRQMDREYKDLADQMQRIEDSLDSKSKNNNVGEVETQERQRKKSSSKVCVVL